MSAPRWQRLGFASLEAYSNHVAWKPALAVEQAGPGRLTIWQLVLQSQLIHPDWDAADHVQFMAFEGRDLVAELTATTDPVGVVEIVERWLAENVAVGRVPG